MEKINQWQSLLERFLESKNIDVNGNSIFNTWESCVPKYLYDKCTLEDVENGQLIITVRHPAIKQELLMHQNKMLAVFKKNHSELLINKFSIFVRKN